MSRLPTAEEDAHWTPYGRSFDGDSLAVECGPADRHGNRLIVASLYGRSHRDCFATDNAYKRQKFREACERQFNIDNPGFHHELEQRILAAADAADAAAEHRTPLKIIPFADLRDANPRLHPPVIDGLLRAGETCNVIADPKMGKSWMVYGLALSIVTGRRWLERFETAQGPVLLVDNELHRSTLAHRIPLVAEAMGIPASQYGDALEVVALRGRLCSLADLACDLEAIEPGTYRAIILDAKYRLMAPGTSENDNADETRFYNMVDQIAESTGAVVVLIHHASKGDQSGKKVTDVGSGAGAQSRAADCHLILRPHEEPGVSVLDAAVRSFPPVDPLALRWEFPVWVPDSGVDTTKLKGRGTKADERQREKDREGKQKTLGALANGPATQSVLRKATGYRQERQENLLNLLCSEGKVDYRETTVRGNKTNEYYLTK